MPDKVLGLDIADSSVKAVQVAGSLKGYQLTDCARIEIEPDTGLPGALKRLFEEMPFDNGTCVASFQADRVSYHNLSMPFKDKKKIGQTLGFELEPMLPFPVEAMATAYVVAKGSEEGRILSASVHKEALGEHLEALAAERVDPEVVDLSAVSTAVQLAKRESTPKEALFIDIGSRGSSVVVLSRGGVTLARSFRFGGDAITGAIARSKMITQQEAEAQKCEGTTDALHEVVEPVVQSFSRQIQNTLHAFHYQLKEQTKPEKLFLTGGGALYPGIAAMFERSLGIPTELVDLAEAIDLEIEEKASQCWNPLFMNSALALALRDTKTSESFNFRVGEFSKRKRYDQFIGELRRIAVYAAVIVLVFVANIYADYYTVKKRNDHLREEIASVFQKTFPDAKRLQEMVVDGRVDPVDQIRVKIRETKESTLLPNDFSEQGAVIDILRDIALRTPEKADLDTSSLTVDESRARLKGLTDNFNTVDAIKNGLQESTYFKEVVIASAQQDRKSEKVRFELVMERK